MKKYIEEIIKDINNKIENSEYIKNTNPDKFLIVDIKNKEELEDGD